MSNFKSKYSLKKRKIESNRILHKYPERFPIIVEKARCSDLPAIDKNKFLVPIDLTMGQFCFVIRRRISLGSEKALYVYIDGYIPSTSMTMKHLYHTKKNEDGFLYVTYCAENTFG